jgi:hyperosmotically inducible periplasmic protein
MSASRFVTASILIGIAGLSVPALQSCRSHNTASEQMSDSAITTKVKSKMIGNSTVKAGDIDVNTEEGVVYLMGRVGSQAEKAEAERLARSCEGVREVVNHLEVGDSPAKSKS